MSCMKTVFAILLLTAIAGVVPGAHATVNVKVMIAGSSAMWQATALAAYKGGAAPPGACVTGGTNGCAHYTAKGFNLTDTRPTLKGGASAVDQNAIWIVWDNVNTDPTCATACDVWAYIKVDSVVGVRCYFAQPRCNVSVSSFPAPGNLISPNTLWGDNSGDSTPPAPVQALFTASGGLLINVGATDIRPEDGLFAMCRANSALDAARNGLGYNSNNSAGSCPTVNDLAHLAGGDVSGTVSTATAHVLAFKISGTDPFSGKAIPAATTVSVGAAPIVFVARATGPLSGVTNVNDSDLHAAFSGADCRGSVFGGAVAPIDVYLREPLSGTMNTTEATVFRYPDKSGTSQEANVVPPGDNPLNQPCAAAGSGNRKRAIGTGDVMAGIFGNAIDAIGYTFFSYGNVAKLADSATFRYLTLNNIDGIFHKYGSGIDPGQPHASTGQIPGTPDLPATCPGGFPCAEKNIWSGNLSFPNLRNGSYRAWSILRFVSDGAALANAKTLATSAQTFVVNNTPDFVPAVPVGTTDPGLRLLRSHYTQEGVAPVNISSGGDKGGDMGGCILDAVPNSSTQSDTTTKLAQAAPGTACVSVP
jgi:hypothetical protein